MPIYIADTNFFVQAHRLHYPFDVVPGFWSKLIDLSNRGIVQSIDKVKSELSQSPDELNTWINSQLPSSFFRNTSTILAEYVQICTWVSSNRQYTTAAINEFLDLDEADAWLCAYGLSTIGHTVIITHEKSEPNIKRKVKIPEVCNHFSLPVINTIDMFRAIGETF
jgi:hypothetical protein